MRGRRTGCAWARSPASRSSSFLRRLLLRRAACLPLELAPPAAGGDMGEDAHAGSSIHSRQAGRACPRPPGARAGLPCRGACSMCTPSPSAACKAAQRAAVPLPPARMRAAVHVGCAQKKKPLRLQRDPPRPCRPVARGCPVLAAAFCRQPAVGGPWRAVDAGRPAAARPQAVGAGRRGRGRGRAGKPGRKSAGGGAGRLPVPAAPRGPRRGGAAAARASGAGGGACPEPRLRVHRLYKVGYVRPRASGPLECEYNVQVPGRHVGAPL